MGGYPPPLTENQCEKKKDFFLNGKGGYPPPLTGKIRLNVFDRFPYKHLGGPLLVFGVARFSQVFCCRNIAAKISVSASTFKQSLLLLKYGPCFFLGLGKGKNRMQVFRVHIAEQ